MRERFMRPSSSTSSKPAVVRMAVAAPFCSRIALVATVVPWMKRSTSAGFAVREREHLRDGRANAREQILGGARHLGER